MCALPVIKRVALLKGIGVFRGYTWPNSLPDFQRYNLVYGFNGSGKTTLSRVFRSLEAGLLQPELPQGGHFAIELSDEQTIRDDASLDLIKDRLLVFNVDFIVKNLRWNEGTADPVFYIGRAQAELSKKLEQTESGAAEVATKLANAQATAGIADRELADHKRDAARTIAEALSLGRRYAAPNLTTDYAAQSYTSDFLLPDGERKQLRQVIAQDAPLPKLHAIVPPSLILAQLVSRTRTLLTATVGTITIDELKKHDTMLNWVKQGLEYHSQHDLNSCLFCGNQLTSSRLDALRAIVDDQFNNLLRNISTTIGEAEALSRNLEAIKQGIPSRNDVSGNVQPNFASESETLYRLIDDGDSMVGAAIALLKQKSVAPNAVIQERGLPAIEYASGWERDVGNSIEAFNAMMAQHNRAHDDFAQIQDVASNRLKQCYLAEGQKAYTYKESAASTALAAVELLTQKRSQLLTEIDKLKSQVRQHGPAADVINKLIAGYLGHEDFQIQPLDVGYQINRKTMRVQGSLSEGEKTAIALCYFLSTLEAENRKLKNLIVVVDDPVSSLDTRALNYAFNLIKATLLDAAQLIILTHNLPFMNETKKWLREKAKGDKPTAAMFLLDAPYAPGTKERAASIVTLPKLVREYDSEYHYLFGLARQFSASGGGYDGYYYLMPNILRKVLEIFLAFKLPGSDGLKSKVENIANGGYGIDPQRLRAIDRLVQLESHADNLEDLVAFSSMTIEETRDAAAALLIIIEALDTGHYGRMTALCA